MGSVCELRRRGDQSLFLMFSYLALTAFRLTIPVVQGGFCCSCCLFVCWSVVSC